MKTVTTTIMRKYIGTIVDRVKYRGEVFAVGRRNSIDAILVQFPATYNKNTNAITNLNAHSKSFDFLSKEPALYSSSDLKKKYV